MAALRIRRSIRDLETAYENGDKKPLETLIRAWRGIQELPPDDPNSFFAIAGYHGEPFRGAGWGNSQWWGGYCAHGNVLFPTWHRAYILRLEKALQTIPGCADVMLPFWDETDDQTKEKGIPGIFLKKQFELDGKHIDNPLYSYTFQDDIFDNLSPIPDADYTKHKGYKTVRYPFSGLVSGSDLAKTQVHNSLFDKMPEEEVNGILNNNITNWLGQSITLSTGTVFPTGTSEKFKRCLKAPNYTVFSNTTSATQWNEDHFGVKRWQPDISVDASKVDPATEAMVALESPHNDIHLAVGGFEIPGQTRDNIEGANGDMGENDTASFDPIFFFHHCFIDSVFWLWQQMHEQTKSLDIIPEYPGTNSVDNQGPTPGVAANIWLTMDSPLDPFKKADGTPMTSKDLVNIEEQLSYTYARSSLSPLAERSMPKEALRDGSQKLTAVPMLRVSGVNRAAISGSFLLSTWATLEGKKQLVGVKSVLSRRHVQGCANCQTHLNVKTFVPLHGFSSEEAQKADFNVVVHTRSAPLGLPLTKGAKPQTHLGHIMWRKH